MFINTVPEKNEGIFKEQEKERKKNSEWENKYDWILLWFLELILLEIPQSCQSYMTIIHKTLLL